MFEFIHEAILALGDLTGLEDMIFPILMALTLLVFLFIGMPVAIALAAAGFLWAFLGNEFGLFSLLPARIFGVMENQTLMSIPLFVFMGVMLERSKVAEELLDVVGHVMGPVRGGMGLAIILIGVLMGASTGIVGATVVTLGAIWIEARADLDLRRFLDRPREPGELLRTGIWKRLRYPNYLGEIGFWWGLWLFGMAGDPSWWWTVIGPLSITLLFVFISVPMMDRRHLARRPAYAERMETTSAILPWIF